MRLAWSAPIEGVGADGLRYATTPIIADGRLYTQDLASTVLAYDLRTGRLRWRHRFPGQPSAGPNGVSLGYGKIYGATATFAFALDANSGRLLWRSRSLIRNGHEGVDMAPAVFDQTVYVSTVPGNATGFYQGGALGAIYALDAETGRKKWRFNTVPASLWSRSHTSINSGGGLWYGPAFDAAGSMFAAVANPGPVFGTSLHPFGSSRPGPNLFTNSLIKLDHSTGKLDWYRQVLPHDLYDWDLQGPPVIANSQGREVVVAAGKMGYVYEFDAATGRLLWKTAVGRHNGHDTDGAKAMSGRPPKLPATILPGSYGGVLTQIAVSHGVIYTPVVDLATRWPGETQLWDSARGEMTALSLATGKLEWKTSLPAPPFGAATVSNDLVYTTTYQGRLIALNRLNGKIAWQKTLPSPTNAPVAVTGRWIATAASIPGRDHPPQIMVYKLGAPPG
jgi:outer membrane protein assembly factor BamB